MWEVREPGTIIQAAERAAEGGNFAAAENLLREAARLQEAELGPRHPDLANTLNNLGIVCEMTSKPDEAEQYFRRAVSIARTSLAPDHPFVATSQKNLRDFCEARGKQIEVPAPSPEPTPAEAAVPTPAPEPEPEPPATEQSVKAESEPVEVPAATAQESRQLPADKLFLRVALGALGPMAMLMVILAAGLPRLGAPELAVPARVVASESLGDTPPPPVPEALPDEPPPAPDVTTTTAAPAVDEHVDDAAHAVEITPASATPAPPSAPPVVLRASLCGDLDDWACDPADRPIPQGPLFFYTQIKSTSVMTVQHRWYQNDRLLQTVKLRVQPNREAGYRTYSRNVMTSDSTGNWRIELRGEDGALLHEERFTVH